MAIRRSQAPIPIHPEKTEHKATVHDRADRAAYAALSVRITRRRHFPLEKAASFCCLFILFFGFFIPARGGEVGAILPVKILYPSKGQEWFAGFLQEELSRQFQLSGFAVLAPETVRLWFNEKPLAGNDSSFAFQQTLKPDWTLALRIQTVLKQVSVSTEIRRFNKKQHSHTFEHVFRRRNPDELIAAILQTIADEHPDFERLLHHPQGYQWPGIKKFYSWKEQIPAKVGSTEWKQHLQNLEALQANHPALSTLIHHQFALMRILEGSLRLPAYVPALNAAEKELRAAMSANTGNDDYHTLLALIHYLRQEKHLAKSESMVANAKNPRNGRALILYGLTIGRHPREGKVYIRQGLSWYPFLKTPAGTLNPYESLVPDLEPWLSGKPAGETPRFRELLDRGVEMYRAKQWDKAKRYFEDAATIDPEHPDALLFLAKIRIAKKDYKGALSMLNSLRKRFPEHAGSALYLGFLHETLKKYSTAETLYRESLSLEPENHRAMLRLSTLLIKTGKLEEARSFLESLTRKYPEYSAGWWNLGLLYHRIGELADAASSLQEVIRLEPANTRVQAMLERIHAEMDTKLER